MADHRSRQRALLRERAEQGLQALVLDRWKQVLELGRIAAVRAIQSDMAGAMAELERFARVRASAGVSGTKDLARARLALEQSREQLATTEERRLEVVSGLPEALGSLKDDPAAIESQARDFIESLGDTELHGATGRAAEYRLLAELEEAAMGGSMVAWPDLGLYANAGAGTDLMAPELAVSLEAGLVLGWEILRSPDWSASWEARQRRAELYRFMAKDEEKARARRLESMRSRRNLHMVSMTSLGRALEAAAELHATGKREFDAGTIGLEDLIRRMQEMENMKLLVTEHHWQALMLNLEILVAEGRLRLSGRAF